MNRGVLAAGMCWAHARENRYLMTCNVHAVESTSHDA